MFIQDTTVIFDNGKNRVIYPDYFDSPISQNGLFYMKFDKGVFILLVPEKETNFIKEILDASRVIINRGITDQLEPPSIDAFEIIFEDGTENPYAILMKAEFWETYPEEKYYGWNGTMVIYCKNSIEPKFLFDKVFYREVETLPCYDDVPEH